jgi:Ca-activated chloride channel family protein
MGAQTQGSIFRSGVEMVALTVTVEKSDGSYVANLDADDFRVFDDGVQQNIRLFRGGEVPIDLVLMIDTSVSMGSQLPTATGAAVQLIEVLRPTDRAAIMRFGSSVELVRTLTPDRPALESAIRSLPPRGETSLYNALYVALREFGPPPGTEFRRRAIVLLSDGDDTTSVVTFDSLRDVARRSGIAIYAIALGLAKGAYAADPKIRQAVYELRTLASETGGRSFFPAGLSDLDGVYGSIERELRHQYALAYLPAESVRDGRYRRVAVVVDHPGARARTRTGYIPGD